MKSMGLTTEKIVRVALMYGEHLMGEDFVGYKFVMGNSIFWNSLLQYMYNKGENVSEILNSDWLSKNNIEVLEHDSRIWNHY